MDSEEEFLVQWLETRRRHIACLVCLVGRYFVVQMCNNKKKRTCSVQKFPLDDHSPGANGENYKRAKKGAAAKHKEPLQISQIAEKMDVIAALLSEGNQVFRERYALQISGEEILKLIRDCGCDQEKIPSIHCFLMNDVAKLRTIIQCPPFLRKQVIMKMVFGY